MAQRSLQPTLTAERRPVSSGKAPSRWAARWGGLLGFAVMVAMDGVLLAAATALPDIASGWRSGTVLTPEARSTSGIITDSAFVLISVTFLTMAKSYDRGIYYSLVRGSSRVAGAVSFASVILAFWTLSLLPPGNGASEWGLVGLGAAAGLVFVRAVAVVASKQSGRWGLGRRHLVIVGNPRNASAIARKLSRERPPFHSVGFVSVREDTGTLDTAEGLSYLGDLRSIPAILKERAPCEVLLTVSPREYARAWNAVAPNVPPGTTLRLALYPLLDGVGIQEAEMTQGFPALRLRAGLYSWEYETFKRIFDLLVTTAALLVAAPLMLIIAVAIKLDSPGPILFRQTRVGRRGQPFQMLKFRSMRQDAEDLREDLVGQNEAAGPMFKIKDDPRITRVGKIIRRLSLDELPQVFNVLDGTMSLVGPRPPLPEEVKEYTARHLRRLEAIPGMTGLWQVKRGDEINFEEMVDLDLKYIETWSFTLDVSIIARTFGTVLGARGAY